jgi:Gas vesicle protein G
VIILDTLFIGGLRFVLEKLAAAVEAERDDDSALREELLAAQMRLELGEITETQFAAVEAELLRGIAEVRARREGEAPAPGALRVTGAEVTLEGDEGEVEAPARPARRRGAKARSPRRR